MNNALGVELQKQMELSEVPSSQVDVIAQQLSEENVFIKSIKATEAEKQVLQDDFDSGQFQMRDVIESGQLCSRESEQLRSQDDTKKFKGLMSHQSSESEDIQVEQMIEAIRIKQKEVEGNPNTSLLIEMVKLIIETKDDRQLKVRANKIVGLYLSFYGLWREAEKLLRWNEQFEMSSSTNKGMVDVYDSVLEIIENQKIMSGMLKLCCRTVSSSANKNQNIKQDQTQQVDSYSPRKSNMQTNINIQGMQLVGGRVSSKANKTDSEVDDMLPESSIPKEHTLPLGDAHNNNFNSMSIQGHEDIVIQGNEDMVIQEHEDEENDSYDKDKGNFVEILMKEVLLVNIIQTFNLRMNVVSLDLCEWFIENEKLNIIELLLENQRMSASTKRINYEKTKRQERKMLNYFQEYLVVASGLYNNEIELLLNLNENGLHLLSMEYTRFLIKYLKIPANYIVNRSLIKEAVSQQNVPLISQMIKYSREMTQQTLLSSRVQNLVKGFLEKADTFVCGLYFLKKMSQKKQRETQSVEYFDNILRLLSRPQNDEQFTLDLTGHCMHPLVICIICSKILLKLSMGKNPFSSEMLKLANFYLSRALSYRDAIFDAREMSILIFKPIFPSDKPLIKALRSSKYSNFFTDFFVHPCISYLLEQKFMSTYGWDKMIFGAFTPVSHFLNHSKFKNPFSKVSNQSSSSSSYTKSMKSVSGNSFSLESRKQNWCIFKDIEISSIDKISKNNHIFSFAIFNKSVAVRMLAEFITFLMIAAFTMYYLFLFIDNFNTFVTADEDAKLLLMENTIPTFLQEGLYKYRLTHTMPDLGLVEGKDYSYVTADPTIVCNNLLTQISYGYPIFMNYFTQNCIIVMTTGQTFQSQLTKVIVTCCLILTLGANVIQKQVYSYLIGKKSDLSVIDYYDILISLVCTVFIIVKQGFIPDGISDHYTLAYFTNYTDILKYASCCIVFLIWIRLFLFLIRSQQIGILVRIIILFVKDLSQFLIVLITVLLAFGTLNYILFQNSLDIYSTFQYAIYNLIAAVFGAFDFNNQDWIQSLILIIFLFAINIGMMNLLIAILNSRYEITMQQSEMEYALIVYNDYINLRFHPLYSCMITLPPPLNVINFILGIPALFFKSRKWNQFALKIEYTFFILIPLMLVFIIVSIAIMPLAYVFMLYRLLLYSISDNLLNARKKPIIYRMALGQVRLFSWIIFGIPYLLVVLLFNDIPLFLKSSFSYVNNKYTFTNNQILDIRVLRYASITSCYLHFSRGQVVNYVEFRNALENKKIIKHETCTLKSIFSTFRNVQAHQFQQLRQAPQQQAIDQNKLFPEKIVEKQFNGAIKKFGDGKLKNEADCVSLPNILKSIKYSALFYKKSKRTSQYLSRLLYIVRKKDLFENLLQQNASNFFLTKSYSFQNVGMSPQQMN